MKIKSKDLKQIFLYIILFIGIAFILREYIGGRSFWLDEAALGINMFKSFKDLLEPLNESQMAPILFLYAAKIPALFLGISDYSLRIIPLLSGIGSLVIFFLLSKQFLNKTAAIISLSLFILSDKLIYYATEFKQYSTEVFFSILLFYLFVLITENGLDVKKSILLGLVGIVAIWSSYTAIIIALSTAICLLYYFIKNKNKKGIIKTLIIGSIWLLNITGEYLFYIKTSTYKIVDMSYYWSFAFMPFPPKTTSDILWLPKSIKEFFIYIYRNDSNLLSNYTPLIKDIFCYMLIAFFIGGIVYTFLKKKGHISIFVLITFILAIIASAIKKYPFNERTILYIAPLILFFAAIGIWLAIKYLSKIHISISILLLIFIFFLPTLSGIYHLIEPTYKNEVKSVINYYNENKKSGDKLYVDKYYLVQFEFYSDADLIDYTDNQDIEEIKKGILGKERVWAIGDNEEFRRCGKIIDYYKIRTLAVILSEKWPFNYISNKLIHLNDPNAEIYLYDFSNN